MLLFRSLVASILVVVSLSILCMLYFILQIPQKITDRVQIDIPYVNYFAEKDQRSNRAGG